MDLTVSIDLAVSKKNWIDRRAEKIQKNLTTEKVVSQIVSAITTGEGTLVSDTPLSGSELGYTWLRNLSVTNYVEWGLSDGGGVLRVLGRMEPGEIAIVPRVVDGDIRLRADTAAVSVQVLSFSV